MLPIFCPSLVVLLIIYSQLHSFMEAIPATFCSGRGVYSWRTSSHRKILLFHHPALLFLTVASFFASNNRICEFLAPTDAAGRDSYSELSFGSHPLIIQARVQHIMICGYPSIFRTTNRHTTHVLKHPGYCCIWVWKVAPSRGRGQADT